MARILAIDYGKKRTGLAVTDPLQLIASGLTTVDSKELLSYLEVYFKSEAVELVLVGAPKQMNNKDSKSELLIKPFIEEFKKKFNHIPVKRVDERFTSKMAFQAMIDGGLKKKARRNKALIDKISATIILQTYLSANKL